MQCAIALSHGSASMLAICMLPRNPPDSSTAKRFKWPETLWQARKANLVRSRDVQIAYEATNDTQSYFLAEKKGD